MSDGEVGVFRKLEMDHDLRESVTNDTQLLPIATDGFFFSLAFVSMRLSLPKGN